MLDEAGAFARSHAVFSQHTRIAKLMPYAGYLLLDTARVLLAFGLVFVALPYVLFPRLTVGPSRHRAWTASLAMSALGVVAIHLLAALNLFDTMTLYLIVGGILVGAYLMQRLDQPGTSVANFLQRGAYLRILGTLGGGRAGREGTPPPTNNDSAYAEPEPDPDAGDDVDDGRSWVINVALGVLLVVSGWVRLMPTLSEIGPFSIRYYAIMEEVKSLQVNTLYPYDDLMAQGMQSLMLALYAFSRVDVAVLTHVFGVLAALAVTYGVFHVVEATTDDPAAAFVGAAAFGLGASLWPLGPEQQVEPNAPLTAAAFALPALFLAGQHVARNGQRVLISATLGLVATVLTDFTLGALAAAGFLFLAGVGFVLGHAQRHARDVSIAGGSVVALLLLGWAVSTWLIPTPDVDNLPVLSTASFTAMDPVGAPPPVTFVRILAVGLVVLLGAVAAVPQFRERRRFLSLTALCTGGVMLLCWFFWETGWLLDARVTNVLLTVTLCLAVGLAAHLLLTGGAYVLREHFPELLGERVPARARPWLRPASALLLVVVLTVAAAPLRPQFAYTVEPPGFVKGMQQVTRNALPYRWTVVSHYGGAVRAMNRGRHMDYGYFLENYDPRTYDHSGANAIPTDEVFIFFKKKPRGDTVLEELMPPGRHVMTRAAEWCQTYSAYHRKIEVVYEDDQVGVCRLWRGNPKPTYAPRRARTPAG